MRGGGKSGLDYRALWLSSDPPRYAPSARGTQSIAYEIRDAGTGKRLIVAPDVGLVSPVFLKALNEADAVLFDGTGEVTAVWTGGRGIPGLALGKRLVVEGVLVQSQSGGRKISSQASAGTVAKAPASCQSRR